MESSIKIDDLGVPLFLETSISASTQAQQRKMVGASTPRPPVPHLLLI